MAGVNKVVSALTVVPNETHKIKLTASLLLLLVVVLLIASSNSQAQKIDSKEGKQHWTGV